MSVSQEITADVRAVLEQSGAMAVPGELERARPALLVRPRDGQDMRIFVWCDEEDGAPVVCFDAVLVTWPVRPVGFVFQSWTNVRNVVRPGIVVRARRVPQSMSETANPNVHATGTIPVGAGLESDLGRLFDQLDALADEVEVFAEMAERSRAAAERRATERRTQPAAAPPKQTAGVEDVLAELDAMTGITEVKELVRGLVDQHRVNAMRTAHGLKAATLSPHLVFTGNPGTGKTTVARIVARAYHAVGLLKKGHLVEVGRADLVAKYVGQTAIRTTELCRRALGGVLFIDEAYSLNKESGNDFGHEAVEALLAFMENHRGEFAVVVAGYPREMGEFMAMNPGLTSRFDTTVRFPDFSDDELCEILLAMFGEHEYVLGPGATERLREAIAALPRSHGFGNARDMRRLFGKIVGSHSRWVSSLGGEPSREILRTIPADLIAVPRDATRLPVPAGGVYL